jgi:phospholipase C
MDRRKFLKMMGVTAGGTAGLSTLPPAIQKALAIEPNNATGTIMDVEHVVILMQENRSFDHYFGTYNGVRGYTDPRPVRLQSTGKDVFNQPITDALKGDKENLNRRCGVPSGATDVLPFHTDYAKTGEDLGGLSHGVSDGHRAWNHGKYDGWIAAKNNVRTMNYIKYNDLSYHRHLANAFTICDHNFSSMHGDTHPNRMFQISGTTVDPKESKPKVRWDQGDTSSKPYTWKTYPERVEHYNNKLGNTGKKKISCRTYQGGTGEPGTPTDNFTDNNLQWFKAYVNQPETGCYFDNGICTKGGARYQGDLTKLPALVANHVTNRSLRQFKKDVDEGNLPNISWICAPNAYCEHSGNATSGAYFINLILDALVANKDVWSKTVFILHYDEHDGYFDHIVPPMPAFKQEEGKLSPSLEKSIDKECFNGTQTFGDEPIGFGPRVPMLIVSPWSKGGWVCSEVFDHTSVLQFLEQRFCPEESGKIDESNTLYESNITPWRRSLAGDLTSAFNFAKPDAVYTNNAQDNKFVKKTKVGKNIPTVPAGNTLPKAENPVTTFGEWNTSNSDFTRNARALPYEFYAHGKLDIDQKNFALDFLNTGKAGTYFYVYDYVKPDKAPKRYTVAANEPLQDSWKVSDKGYDLTVHGPNGFLCQFKGKASATKEAIPEVEIMYQENGNVTLKLNNNAFKECNLQITSAYTKIGSADDTAISTNHRLRANMCPDDFVEYATKDGWYDLTIELLDNNGKPDGVYLRRFAGHVETGKPSVTDPFLTYNQVEDGK